jgi:hypothetical protein
MTTYHLAGSYATAMRTVAEQARRNTHLIVATNKGTGEVVSQHARPRREAVEYRDTWRTVLGSEWTVKVVPLRRWWR